MKNDGSWIKFTEVGFTKEEQQHLRDNPIKVTCVCGKDLTGINSRPKECTAEEGYCVLEMGDC